jgi:hypothetical protein
MGAGEGEACAAVAEIGGTVAMGLYAIPCRRCGKIFLWFSGNTFNQNCADCQNPYGPKPQEGENTAATSGSEVSQIEDAGSPPPTAEAAKP